MEQEQQTPQTEQIPAKVQTDASVDQEPTDEVVMVYDKENKQARAIADLSDENGNFVTVDPTNENANKFLRITDRGFWPNLWTNLKTQFNDPAKFAIFRIPTHLFEQSKVAFQRHADQSDKQAGEFLYNFLVASDGRYEKNAKLYDLTPERLPFHELSAWHITKDLMDRFGAMPSALRGDWTPLLPFWKREENAYFKGCGKLKFSVNTRTGKVAYKLHTIQSKPEIELDSKYGHVLTQEDKTNLLETLNMGHLGTITDSKTGEKFPAYFSYDEDLGEIFAQRADRVNFRRGTYGHNFTEQEIKDLKEGGVIVVDGLKGRPDQDGNIESFKGKLQFNAQKGRVSLVYSRQQRLNNRLERQAARRADKEVNLYMLPRDQFIQMLGQQDNHAETAPQQNDSVINQAPPEVRPESNEVSIGENLPSPAPVQTDNVQIEQKTDNSPDKSIETKEPKITAKTTVIVPTQANIKEKKGKGPSLT